MELVEAQPDDLLEALQAMGRIAPQSEFVDELGVERLVSVVRTFGQDSGVD